MKEQVKRELNEEASNRFNQLLEKYIKNIEDDVIERWNAWDKDVSTPELYEVISAILCRQVTIAINFVNNSSIWNGHIAPIIMRSLVDNYINFAWILLDPLVRSQQFIYYGLGQEKLSIEHYKAQFDEDSLTEEFKTLIEAKESWVSQQRYTFLTDVSLKSWSEKNVRQMAEEAGCIDLYNYVYQPFSSAAHNMWNHVGRYNLIESDNPLHKFLKKPAIFKFTPEVYYLELTVKYVAKMFSKFDETFSHKATRNSFDEFHTELDTISEKFFVKKDNVES